MTMSTRSDEQWMTESSLLVSLGKNHFFLKLSDITDTQETQRKVNLKTEDYWLKCWQKKGYTIADLPYMYKHLYKHRLKINRNNP